MTPLLASAALPQQIVPNTCTGVDCSLCDLTTLAQNVLNTGIYIAIFLSAVLFAWAGWLYLSNNGNAEQASRAKSTFTNVAIGIVIILSAWLVVSAIMHTLAGSNGSLPWNKLC